MPTTLAMKNELACNLRWENFSTVNTSAQYSYEIHKFNYSTYYLARKSVLFFASKWESFSGCCIWICVTAITYIYFFYQIQVLSTKFNFINFSPKDQFWSKTINYCWLIHIDYVSFEQLCTKKPVSWSRKFFGLSFVSKSSVWRRIAQDSKEDSQAITVSSVAYTSTLFGIYSYVEAVP